MSTDVLCPHFEDHTPSPEGYIQWHAWAEFMGATHRQRKCRGCGLYAIWEPKSASGIAARSDEARAAGEWSLWRGTLFMVGFAAFILIIAELMP